MRLFVPLLLLVATSCAQRAAAKESPDDMAAALRDSGCDPECEKNLSCIEGECGFEQMPCATDASCKEPYLCVEGFCALPGGSACRFASQCASKKCVWGVCQVEL